MGLRCGLAEDCSQDIRSRFVVARAQAVTDLYWNESAHRPESFGEFRQQSGPGGRHELMRLVTLLERNGARAENLERGRRRNRKTPVRAINPPCAFDHCRRPDGWLSQQFEARARADNIHDRVNGAYFVEMHLLWRLAVDFAFRNCDAMEDRDGLLLHPIR